MKLTNIHGIPQVFQDFIKSRKYSREGAWRSITQLIDAPQVIFLREKHHADMEQDVSEQVWSLLGSAVHLVLENSKKRSDNSMIVERRFHAVVNGKTISGQVDLLEDYGYGKTISDYKVTSVSSFQRNKPEWEKQLNGYAALVRYETGWQIAALQIVCIMRDWLGFKAKVMKDYPQAPIQIASIPLWSNEKQDEFLKQRVDEHAMAELGLYQPCTDEERWRREKNFAVIRSKNKMASCIVPTREEAEAYIRDTKKPEEYRISERPANAIRCSENFCGVAAWCEQWAKEKEENDAKSGTE